MTPPLVVLHLDSPDPAYRQIASSLRRHLVDGRMKPDDVLPPVRQLALDLGEHSNTVAQAYRTLAAEGWLDLRRRRGAMVIARDTPRAPKRGQVEALLVRLKDLLTAELRNHAADELSQRTNRTVVRAVHLFTYVPRKKYLT